METFMLIFIVVILATPVMAFVMYRLWKERKDMQTFKSLLSGMGHEQQMIELTKLQTKINNTKTNHILHFLITFFTAGVWIIPWVLIASQNSSQQQQLNKMMESI